MQDEPRGAVAAWLGLFLGPTLFLVCLWLLPDAYMSSPDGGAATILPFPWAGRATLAAMVWLGVWWLTEAAEISVTALLPIVLFPVCGIASLEDACFPYADPLVFLYLAGFVLAMAMERWGLGRRIALLTLTGVGTSAGNMIAGMMLVTAGLSAFVSNTATTAMMLPIGLSIIQLVRGPAHPSGAANSPDSNSSGAANDPQAVAQFGVCLLLAIAYAASIGGMATLVGTPTNAFLASFLKDKIAPEYQQDLTFAAWLPIGGPLVLLLLPITYWLLTRWLYPISQVRLVGGKELIRAELIGLGRIRRGEWNVATVFSMVVVCWLTRPLWNGWGWSSQGESIYPFRSVSDTGIAMTGAFLLFLLPVDARRREFTMNWGAAEKLPWGILLLFGGGLSLAAAVKANGVSEFIGSQVVALHGIPAWLLVLLVTAAVIFLTELTSNAATTASLVPVLAAVAPGLGVHPYLLIFPATLAASCAFMLPVATPPNAIVFGSGLISIPQMARAGLWLNLIGTCLIVILTMGLIQPWFGL